MENFLKMVGLDFCRKVIESASEGIAVVGPDHKHLWVNQMFLKMFNYEESEKIIGQPLSLIVHPDDLNKIMELRRLQQQGQDVPPLREVKTIKSGGQTLWCEISVTYIKHQTEELAVIFLRDITERKKNEEELRALSLTDELTNLYNRRGFTLMAGQELKLARRLLKNLTIFFVDVDALKNINDTLGHQVGDEAIVGTAEVLRRAFRDTDIIGRLGGDEFVILAVEVSFVEIKIILRRLNEEVKIFNQTEGNSFQLSLSSGVAHYDPANPISLEELITSADTEMYKYKKRKKG